MRPDTLFDVSISRNLDHRGTFDSNRSPPCAGFTATPERGDKGGPGAVWQKILYRKTILVIMLAEFELQFNRQQVKADINRARRQGKRIVIPRVIVRRGFFQRFGVVLEGLNQGSIFRSQTPKELHIGYALLLGLLESLNSGNAEESA